MPPAARPWFRFYVEAFADRKLRRLPPAYRWLLAACFGIARQSPRPGWLLFGNDPATVEDVMDFAGLSRKDVEGGMTALMRSDPPIIEHVEIGEGVGAWHVVKWDARQYESDTSTERTRRHRSKQRGGNVPSNGQGALPGTAPETEPDTDQDRVAYPAEFEHAWQLYPPRPNNPKKPAFACWNERLREGVTVEQLTRAVEVYAAERAHVPVDERQFTMQAKTFLGPNERWSGYLEPSGNGSSPAPALEGEPPPRKARTCPLGLCYGTTKIINDDGQAESCPCTQVPVT